MEENLPISQQLLITPLNGRPHRYRIITTISYFVWHTSRILNVESALSAKMVLTSLPTSSSLLPCLTGHINFFSIRFSTFKGGISWRLAIIVVMTKTFSSYKRIESLLFVLNAMMGEVELH